MPGLRPGRGPREGLSLELEKLALDRVALLPRRLHHGPRVVLLPRGFFKLTRHPKVMPAAARVLQPVANLIGDEFREVRLAFPRENLPKFGRVGLRVENLPSASALNLVSLLLPRGAFLALHQSHAQLLAVVVLEHVVIVVTVQLPQGVVGRGFGFCTAALFGYLEVFDFSLGADVAGDGRRRFHLGAFHRQTPRVLRRTLLRAVSVDAHRGNFRGSRGQCDGLAPGRGGENFG